MRHREVKKFSLYPPQILGLHFCRLHLTRGEFPQWYETVYGIKNPRRFYAELAKMRLIAQDTKGKWAPTERGQKELEENRHILWAHQNSYDVWMMAEKTQNLSGDWKEKVRYFLEKEMDDVVTRTKKEFSGSSILREAIGEEAAMKEFDDGLSLGRRVILHSMMKFERQYGDKNLADKYEEEIDELDRKIGRK